MVSTATQKLLLVLSVLLTLLGLGLTIGGAFSPAWQVVDIREFRAEHQVSHTNKAVIVFSTVSGGIAFERNVTLWLSETSMMKLLCIACTSLISQLNLSSKTL